MQPCVSYVILSRVNTHHAQPDMLRMQHHHQREPLHPVSPAFSRCYADPSRQHMIHGRRANQNACFLIDRDPSVVEIACTPCFPHANLQTFLFRRAPRYALVVGPREKESVTSLRYLVKILASLRVSSRQRTLVTWYPALLLYSIVPDDESGFANLLKLADYCTTCCELGGR
jgi:hypothetical protein